MDDREMKVTSKPFTQRIVFGASAVAVGIALFSMGFWTGSARGEGERPVTVSTPDWFLPISDYYDRNPAVTPAFDFAALYAGETPGAGPAGR